ncbi:hypothetical protein GCM10009612_12600 [Streptomyces beijiangensis]
MNANAWISERQDFTAPYVDNVDTEEAMSVLAPASDPDAPTLQLGAGAAPADYDTDPRI